jgi:hypothetical protein
MTDVDGDEVAGPEPRDLVADPQLRVALQVARSWGVSPSEFFGVPRRTVTEHEYDATGRVTRTVTMVDGWTDEDRGLAYDLAEYDADCCDGCGQPLSVTTLKENSDAYVLDPDVPFVRCHYCTGAEVHGAMLEKWPHNGALRLRLQLSEARVARNRAIIDAELAAAAGEDGA